MSWIPQKCWHWGVNSNPDHFSLKTVTFGDNAFPEVDGSAQDWRRLLTNAHWTSMQTIFIDGAAVFQCSYLFSINPSESWFKLWQEGQKFDHGLYHLAMNQTRIMSVLLKPQQTSARWWTFLGALIGFTVEKLFDNLKPINTQKRMK